MMYATYSPEDNKLRLKTSSRLDADTYQRVKDAGFKWAPKQDLFVAPMWTPSREDLLIELCGEIGDEDTSLVERAEERAERFGGYSVKRAMDYEHARSTSDEISERFAGGQPILVGHHSERRARRDAKRIEDGMRKAIKMWETSEYWQSRAKGAIRAAKHKELPRVRANRIKGLEADKRKQERNKTDAEIALKFWTKGNMTHEQAVKMAGCTHKLNHACVKGEHGYHSAWDVLRPDEERWSGCPAWTLEQVIEKAREVYPRRIAYANRWINHLDNRLLYEKAMLEEAGASDLLKPAPRPTQLPLCNYRAPEGVQVRKMYGRDGEKETYPQIEMTKAEYAKLYDDYKGTRIVGGSHRVRIAVIKRCWYCVFLTDSKVHDKPAPVDNTSSLEVALDVAAMTRPVYVPPQVTEEQKEVKAMRDALKTGIKTVVAPQLFPTPPEIAARMVELAEIENGQRILEPSAGTGNIVKAIREDKAEVVIYAIEKNYNVFSMLERCVDRSWYTAVNADFLEQNGNLGQFDRIIMNPPFKNGADIQHIRHAYDMLKPGGRLVALCANGPRQREAFRDVADYWEDLPEGSFKEQGTGVRVAMLMLTKPSDQEEAKGQAALC